MTPSEQCLEKAIQSEYSLAILLKTLLSVASLALCFYSLQQFDFNIWPMMFAVFACIVFLSIFVDALNAATIVIARIMGVLSLMGLLLLLLAATIGGNFHLSHSNQIVAVGLAGMALLGCAFFFLRIRPPHLQTHVSDKQQHGNRG